MSRILQSFLMAFKDAKANFFHTMLSILGMVIGVAALVGILSLIDGMEKFAHEQITSTTSLESILIKTKTTQRIDNVTVENEDHGYFDYASFKLMMNEIGEDAKGYMRYQESGYLNVGETDKKRVTLFSGIIDTWNEELELLGGRFLNSADLKGDSVAVLNKTLATVLANNDTIANLLNASISYQGGIYKIVGIIDGTGDEPEIFVPITLIPEEAIRKKPPLCILTTATVNEVPVVAASVKTWIETHFDDKKDDFSIITNEFRVEQANQGFLVFRIVMGLIVGVSVLVGGIGVMNVLLISVTERTTEIGVRKAVGAKRRDIILQFLSESLTISLLGSVFGLVLGILFTMAAVPIINQFANIPFHASYTLNTLLTISVVAVIVGIVFGTYPAVKAAKLDPVEAMRRE